jgi:predicted site-specific integrase-resolvase
MAKSAAKNVELDQYVSKQVVLMQYGISERTLASWIKRKKIPYLRLTSKCFRYRLADIEKALARHQVKEVEA